MLMIGERASPPWGCLAQPVVVAQFMLHEETVPRSASCPREYARRPPRRLLDDFIHYCLANPFPLGSFP